MVQRLRSRALKGSGFQALDEWWTACDSKDDNEGEEYPYDQISPSVGMGLRIC